METAIATAAQFMSGRLIKIEQQCKEKLCALAAINNKNSRQNKTAEPHQGGGCSAEENFRSVRFAHCTSTAKTCFTIKAPYVSIAGCQTRLPSHS
jgi:hypothetical protein